VECLEPGHFTQPANFYPGKSDQIKPNQGKSKPQGGSKKGIEDAHEEDSSLPGIGSLRNCISARIPPVDGLESNHGTGTDQDCDCG
jgi:hypothetical protein